MRFSPQSILPMLGLLAVTLLAGGCEKALFTKQQSRTPYDRYMALRGRQAALTSDQAGAGKSSAMLRERLKPLGEP